jgi:hypothetical protein
MVTRPWVKPGEQLDFARALKEKNLWPPRDKRPKPNPDKRAVTAFIVMPARNADVGDRPIADTSWLNSAALRLRNENSPGTEDPPQFEDNPRKGQSYRIFAKIENLGAAPLLGGFAEFYVADPIWLDKQLGFLVGSPENATPKWLGVSPFSLGIGGNQWVQSRRVWAPTTDYDLMRALVVRAFDPLADRMTSQWDSWNDRHVARRDLAPNFAGRWTGYDRPDRSRVRGFPVTIRIDTIPGMQPKAAFKSDGSYPSGDFECTVTLEEFPNRAQHGFPPLPISNVQYAFGRLQLVGYSTNSADPQAIMTTITLTQQADGYLHMTRTSIPMSTGMIKMKTHATLVPA